MAIRCCGSGWNNRKSHAAGSSWNPGSKRTLSLIHISDALHGLEGLKHLESSLVPPIYDPHVPDRILRVTTEDGWDMSDRLAREEGLHVGHSSGANVFAALQLAEEAQRSGRGGCVVTIACDRGDRYFAPMKWERRYVW